MQTVTVAERPDLLERAWEETIGTIPEYNPHGDVINAYRGRLTEERRVFQFYLLDDDRPRPRSLAPGLGTAASPICRPGSTARSPEAR
jgi:hypothetical protein